jgi:outer membrane biosynthesis protein TonB
MMRIRDAGIWRKIAARHTPELEFAIEREQQEERLTQARRRLAYAKLLVGNEMTKDYATMELVMEAAQPEFRQHMREQAIGKARKQWRKVKMWIGQFISYGTPEPETEPEPEPEREHGPEPGPEPEPEQEPEPEPEHEHEPELEPELEAEHDEESRAARQFLSARVSPAPRRRPGR